MTAATEIAFENTFVRDLEGLYLPWNAAPAPEPRLVLLNEALCGELGLDPGVLRGPDGLGLLTGTAVPESATTVAQSVKRGSSLSSPWPAASKKSCTFVGL